MKRVLTFTTASLVFAIITTGLLSLPAAGGGARAGDYEVNLQFVHGGPSCSQGPHVCGDFWSFFTGHICDSDVTGIGNCSPWTYNASTTTFRLTYGNGMCDAVLLGQLAPGGKTLWTGRGDRGTPYPTSVTGTMKCVVSSTNQIKGSGTWTASLSN